MNSMLLKCNILACSVSVSMLTVFIMSSSPLPDLVK